MQRAKGGSMVKEMENVGANARVSGEGPGMADEEAFGRRKGLMKWQIEECALDGRARGIDDRISHYMRPEFILIYYPINRWILFRCNHKSLSQAG